MTTYEQRTNQYHQNNLFQSNQTRYLEKLQKNERQEKDRIERQKDRIHECRMVSTSYKNMKVIQKHERLKYYQGETTNDKMDMHAIKMESMCT